MAVFSRAVYVLSIVIELLLSPPHAVSLILVQESAVMCRESCKCPNPRKSRSLLVPLSNKNRKKAHEESSPLFSHQQNNRECVVRMNKHRIQKHFGGRNGVPTRNHRNCF